MKNILKIQLDSNRIFGLDILRALAIFFVVAGHGAYLMPAARYKYVNLLIFEGVSMFFVLSGFLIGGILIKIIHKEEFTIKTILNFWIRRWMRTIPVYVLILVVLLILNVVFVSEFEVYDKAKYFIFSQNLFYEHPDFFPEAWSLSIEEWFYLLTPLSILICLRLGKISIKYSLLITALIIILGATLFRYYRYLNLTIDDIEMWDTFFRKQVVTRLDSIMYGVIGALLFYYKRNLWVRFRVPFFVTGILLFLMSKYILFDNQNVGLYESVFHFTITAIATLCILPFLSNITKGRGVSYKVVTYISLISYSMYLINLTIIQHFIIRQIHWKPLQDYNGYIFIIVQYLLYWILTIIISILLYKYFEMPIMKLRDRMKIK